MPRWGHAAQASPAANALIPKSGYWDLFSAPSDAARRHPALTTSRTRRGPTCPRTGAALLANLGRAAYASPTVFGATCREDREGWNVGDPLPAPFSSAHAVILNPGPLADTAAAAG